MEEPFLGMINLFPYTFAPQGWLECAGQTMSIMQNQALYSLIGVKFGGDGRTTFMLPNLSGAMPIPEMKYYIATEGLYPQRS